MSIIDASRWQGVIHSAQFAAGKTEGLTRAVIKAGGADAGVYKDADHDANVSNARAAGLGIDHYWFNGPGDAASNAATFLAFANGKPGDRYWLDCESEGSMAHDTPAVALVFTNYVRAHANRPDVVGVYMSSSVTNEADWSANAAVDALWVANYGANTGAPGTPPRISHWKSWTYWQYTSVGHISALGSMNVDLSQEGAVVRVTSAAPAAPIFPEDDMPTFIHLDEGGGKGRTGVVGTAIYWFTEKFSGGAISAAQGLAIYKKFVDGMKTPTAATNYNAAELDVLEYVHGKIYPKPTVSVPAAPTIAQIQSVVASAVATVRVPDVDNAKLTASLTTALKAAGLTIDGTALWKTMPDHVSITLTAK